MESVKSTTVNWFGIENCAGRVQYDDPRMFHFKSWSPNTTFAPRINCPIFVDRIEEYKCKKILEDWGWSNCERPWSSYNFFYEHKKNNLLEEIMLMTGAFCDILDVELIDNLWIRGWLNKLETGESLPVHHHSIHENTYLSGNMLLTESSIPTEYTIPGWSLYGDNLKPPSKVGTTTIFPSWVEHEVKEVDSPRIALAWDLYTYDAMLYAEKNNPNNEMMLSIPFKL
jgi:hypothetical protein